MEQIRVKLSAPISENPAPAKPQSFKPPRGRGRQQTSGRTWVDAEHRVISSTVPTFSTSPRSRPKFMGKSAGSLTSAPASSSSNHGPGKSSARDVENASTKGNLPRAASNPKRKASSAAGTQDSNNTGKPLKCKKTAPSQGKDKGPWKL
ncbi:hypothetical protein COLO4_38391 [Corchorus olitorius]|uniref:Uncharacterized protein n=1 Tax=Corchorus olitorius TaxID=93759 RepID=A0A1R3FV99_9ROSI|nr:hypothetical protein COLO4_38391 [Corchorus olitorius]